jgi:pSer/pThr/pTyr-binding forkhead associated (FHA) protein
VNPVLADVAPYALSLLKYGLFALLFLFIWRSTRWVVRGLTVETPAPPPPRGTKAKPAPDAPPPFTVVVQEDGAKPHTVRLEASMVIGRAPECDLRLDDTFVSQQHARLFGKAKAWYVEDLGSTNGTFVNEQQLVAPAMIQPGDRVRIGTTVLEMRR